jgi:hypothetical protein
VEGPAVSFLTRTLLDLYENLIPFNTYRINCNSFLRVFSRSGRGVEGPGVPGTNQFAVFNHALGQRASAVRAFVVQGANDPVDIGDTKCPRAGVEFPGCSRTRQLPLRADPDQCAHGSVFAAVGLPGAIGLPGGHPGGLFVRKIARLLLHSVRKDVVSPFAQGFVVDRYGGTLMSFVAHIAEHTLHRLIVLRSD